MKTKEYKENEKPEIGEMRVWHIPQVPGKAFHIRVDNIKEAHDVLHVLANYDLFQYKNKIKGDYSNASGLEVYVTDYDGEGNPGWNEWHNDDGYDLDDVAANGQTLEV
jgi:hypothetical protein